MEPSEGQRRIVEEAEVLGRLKETEEYGRFREICLNMVLDAHNQLAGPTVSPDSRQFHAGAVDMGRSILRLIDAKLGDSKVVLAELEAADAASAESERDGRALAMEHAARSRGAGIPLGY